MTKTETEIAPKGIRSVAAIILLVVVVLVVVSYFGNYRSQKAPGGTSPETTASADATASSEATQSPEGGEGEAATVNNGTVIVLIDGLNFRTEPSKGGDLIKGLDEGTKLTYIETSEGWYKVRTAEGKVGYVSASGQYTELQQ